MNDKQADAKHYCPYFRSDCGCALLQAMTDVRCKVWRGENSVKCRYLDTQVARRS
ncbi:hypothetical protein [Paenibacillus sp. JCM 10914]|uniref:hypothetical protein n=1 Tax=Paenibacillus sp. JCM 10914 TaxID=1236974 RepID=UPI0012E1C5DF|nr:hypothetical protein [Paenibacillus sp. JCM 10914]